MERRKREGKRIGGENLLTPIRKESMKEKFEVVYDATKVI